MKECMLIKDTEEIKDRDGDNKAYINSYSDDKNRIRYISEIVCEPNDCNKAKEPYYIRKVHSVKPANI